MSKQEDRRRFQIIEGPTALSMSDIGLFLTQGNNAIAFTTPEDFMEFVSRVGILAVRLNQIISDAPAGDTNPTDTNQET